MEKIKRLSQDNLPSLMTFLETLESKVDEKGYERILAFLEYGKCYGLIDEKGSILALALGSTNLALDAFPSSLHPGKDCDELLSSVGIQGEDPICIYSFLIHKRLDYQQKGKLLLGYMEASFPKTSILIFPEALTNEKAMRFFQENGFHYFSIQEKTYALKKYKRDGLARGFAW